MFFLSMRSYVKRKDDLCTEKSLHIYSTAITNVLGFLLSFFPVNSTLAPNEVHNPAYSFDQLCVIYAGRVEGKSDYPPPSVIHFKAA